MSCLTEQIIHLPQNVSGVALQKRDFDSPTLYKVYKYLANMALFSYPTIHAYFADDQIKMLFDMAVQRHPQMQKIYNTGSSLTGRYNNYIGDRIKYPEKSKIRAMINKLPLENIYGKALALDVLLMRFSGLLHKDDIERTPEEKGYYIVFKSKEDQLRLMNDLFGGIIN